MIARTESIGALGAGQLLMWRQAVADGKMAENEVRRRWVYTHDDRVRPAHVAIPGMNLDGVGLNQPFATPDGPLMYPGDPSGPPQATVNCRCVVVLRYVPGGI